MSMAASIESRVPFLDHELVEFAFTLPSNFKISRAQGKVIHREAMKTIVPPEIYNRKDKAVFGSPFHTVWMRGGMKNTIDGMLASKQFRTRGTWDLSSIRKRWQQYLQGNNSQAEMIFNVLALETWFRRFSD